MTNTALNERPKLDRLQLVALAGLMCLGVAFVFSATVANQTAATLPWYDQSWVRQMVWYARRCASWIITRWRAGRWWLTGRRFSFWSLS
jgi:cell division protein FtsW (lipid II flippase)